MSATSMRGPLRWLGCIVVVCLLYLISLGPIALAWRILKPPPTHLPPPPPAILRAYAIPISWVPYSAFRDYIVSYIDFWESIPDSDTPTNEGL